MKDYWRKGLGNDFPLAEREFLFELAQQANPGTIVNIGVNRGTSLHCLAAGAPQSKIIGIDIEFRTPILERDRLPGNVELIEANSTTYNKIDKAHIVFVDGSHEYVMVKDDIANWTPRLVSGGVIAFHDYRPPEQFEWRLDGVMRAVNEWYGTIANWVSIGEVIGSIYAFRKMK